QTGELGLAVVTQTGSRNDSTVPHAGANQVARVTQDGSSPDSLVNQRNANNTARVTQSDMLQYYDSSQTGSANLAINS
ncbi:curlin subunit CsgB, partial [Cobetia marina]